MSLSSRRVVTCFRRDLIAHFELNNNHSLTIPWRRGRSHFVPTIVLNTWRIIRRDISDRLLTFELNSNRSLIPNTLATRTVPLWTNDRFKYMKDNTPWYIWQIVHFWVKQQSLAHPQHTGDEDGPTLDIRSFYTRTIKRTIYHYK